MESFSDWNQEGIRCKEMLQTGQITDKQKLVKKDKEKDENLLKNTVCKRLTYNCGNGILQEKEM